MNSRLRLRSLTFAFVTILAAALFAVGCGGSDDSSSDDSGSGDKATTETSDSGGGSDSAGKDLFSKTCGGCHTLSAAGTTGTVGPDLDQLKPDKDTVAAQIENGGGGMPPKLLEGGDADTVAAYVADNAGK